MDVDSFLTFNNIYSISTQQLYLEILFYFFVVSCNFTAISYHHFPFSILNSKVEKWTATSHKDTCFYKRKDIPLHYPQVPVSHHYLLFCAPRLIKQTLALKLRSCFMCYMTAVFIPINSPHKMPVGTAVLSKKGLEYFFGTGNSSAFF